MVMLVEFYPRFARGRYLGEVTVAADFCYLVHERLHFALVFSEGNSLRKYIVFRNVRHDKLADEICSHYCVTRTVT